MRILALLSLFATTATAFSPFGSGVVNTMPQNRASVLQSKKKSSRSSSLNMNQLVQQEQMERQRIVEEIRKNRVQELQLPPTAEPPYSASIQEELSQRRGALPLSSFAASTTSTSGAAADHQHPQAAASSSSTTQVQQQRQPQKNKQQQQVQEALRYLEQKKASLWNRQKGLN